MTPLTLDPAFAQLRPALLRLAYRMLGSMADAEDVVQSAYIRWQATDRDAVRQPAAFLRVLVTRLCINAIKAARRRREAYLGAWLPEPVVDPDPATEVDDITMPLMLALERLSPLERAAFLLHDVFGMAFEEIAVAIHRSPAACRKLATRARLHVEAARPRFPVSRETGMKLAEAFYIASRSGDLDALRRLLADDVSARSDGGNQVSATPHPLLGLDAVMARHEELAEEFSDFPSRLIRFAFFDGAPGFITVERYDILQATILQIDGGKVVGIFVIRNPDKLHTLQANLDQ